MTVLLTALAGRASIIRTIGAGLVVTDSKSHSTFSCNRSSNTITFVS